VSVGLFLMHGIGVHSEWTTLLAGLLVAGVGIGLSNPAIGSTALGVVDPVRSGMASGFSNTCRIGGVAVGVAGLGAVFLDRINAKLTELVPHVPGGLSDAVASGGARSVAHAGPPGARAHLVSAARQAFISGLNEILLVG